MVLIEYTSTPARHIMPVYLKASCTSEICPQLSPFVFFCF
uniref:Uncharacterized protein n=1 Tax=Anguilla anguilla TaxID=7936 RepID=A0A0E9R7Q4_ANGAN